MERAGDWQPSIQDGVPCHRALVREGGGGFGGGAWSTGLVARGKGGANLQSMQRDRSKPGKRLLWLPWFRKANTRRKPVPELTSRLRRWKGIGTQSVGDAKCPRPPSPSSAPVTLPFPPATSACSLPQHSCPAEQDRALAAGDSLEERDILGYAPIHVVAQDGRYSLPLAPPPPPSIHGTASATLPETPQLLLNCCRHVRLPGAARGGCWLAGGCWVRGGCWSGAVAHAVPCSLLHWCSLLSIGRP